MKNKKYRLLSMGGFEMLREWINYVDCDYPESVSDFYELLVNFVKHSCNIDIALTKQRIYFYDKINGNQYYIQKKYVFELARCEIYTKNKPSKVMIKSIYMDRKWNRKWINAQNLIKRY